MIFLIFDIQDILEIRLKNDYSLYLWNSTTKLRIIFSISMQFNDIQSILLLF